MKRISSLTPFFALALLVGCSQNNTSNDADNLSNINTDSAVPSESTTAQDSPSVLNPSEESDDTCYFITSQKMVNSGVFRVDTQDFDAASEYYKGKILERSRTKGIDGEEALKNAISVGFNGIMQCTPNNPDCRSLGDQMTIIANTVCIPDYRTHLSP